jgi:hypothetical protein
MIFRVFFQMLEGGGTDGVYDLGHCDRWGGREFYSDIGVRMLMCAVEDVQKILRFSRIDFGL